MKLLTRTEAADRCRVSLAAFDAHVRPTLTPKRIGRRVLFLESDLEAWAESLLSDAKTKPGRSPAQPPTRYGTRGSPLRVALQNDPRAATMRAKLTRKLQGSSLRREQEASAMLDGPSAKVLQLTSRRSS